MAEKLTPSSYQSLSFPTFLWGKRKKRSSPSSSSRPRRVSHSRLHNFAFPTLNWGKGKRSSLSSPPQLLSLSTLNWVKRKRSSSSSSPIRPYRSRLSCKVSHLHDFSFPTLRRCPDHSLEVEMPRFSLTLSKDEIAEDLLLLKGVKPSLRSSEVEMPRFSLTLSKDEIAEDLLLLKGVKPSRRPKKRPKKVQRQLDLLFPGMVLPEITIDRYMVDDSGVSGCDQLIRGKARTDNV